MTTIVLSAVCMGLIALAAPPSANHAGPQGTGIQNRELVIPTSPKSVQTKIANPFEDGLVYLALTPVTDSSVVETGLQFGGANCVTNTMARTTVLAILRQYTPKLSTLFFGPLGPDVPGTVS